MKRILAILLCLLMIISLVGCGKKKRQPIELTLSTEDSEAILNAAGIRLPKAEDVTATGTTIKYFSWFDSIHNYTENEVVNTGYWTFREKYQGTVEYIETTYENRYSELAALIMSEESPDFFPCGISSEATFPMYCIKGTFQAVDKYIDYTDPLWSGAAEPAEYYALGDIHYAFVTDVTFRNVVPYNRRIITEYGYDDPAELYYNDDWTWDVFAEMCRDFSDGDANRYALDGYAYNGALVQEATGKKFIYKDPETGYYYSNLDDPVIEAANNLLYDLIKDNCCYHEGNNYWAGRNNHETGAGVKDGLTLFYITYYTDIVRPVEEIAATWGDLLSEEVMFVPLPRYQDGDGNYYLAAIPTGYMLVSGAKNPEGVYLYSACERFKLIDPTVMRIDKKQLQEKYSWTQEMLDMYDECREIILNNSTMYLNGNLIDNLNTAYNHFRDDLCRGGGSSTWAQIKEQYKDSFEFYLEEQNSEIENYIASLG